MTKKEELERQITAMEKLGFTKEEIADILATDAEIDHGAKLFDLDPEAEKIAKSARGTGTRKAPEKRTVTRKENATKAQIIAEIARFLTENPEISCENVEITNKERMIALKCGENSYEITLIQKRKPKN